MLIDILIFHSLILHSLQSIASRFLLGFMTPIIVLFQLYYPLFPSYACIEVNSQNHLLSVRICGSKFSIRLFNCLWGPLKTMIQPGLDGDCSLNENQRRKMILKQSSRRVIEIYLLSFSIYVLYYSDHPNGHVW
jgi:hypothetical protein